MNARLGKGVRAPRQEYFDPSAAPQPHAAPDPAPQPSATFMPPQPPLRSGVPPPQPSTSGGVPSGPPPPRSRGSRSSSESEASETESEVAARDNTSARLADLIYEACPHSRPLLDDSHPPRCDFEGWFGQPECSASRPHFRLYPRVGEVESEVTARAEALARRSKPLSQLLPSRSNRHAVADLPLYASSLAVNPSFAQLSGAKAVGSRCWGSISFSEMERLERLFRSQLEMTSKSLWLISGILAMLKRDGFQPADPTLFNAALASASATLSLQARSSASGYTFIRAKRRDSLLAHTAIPVPETQRHALTVSPGTESLLFNEEILGVVVTQVQQSSLISSNLAVSRSLGRGRGRSSSSPLVNPSAAGSSRSGKPCGKRSASSSRYGGRKRFRGGKGLAPSSGPSGFRQWEPSPCLTLSGSCLSLHWQAWRDRGADPVQGSHLDAIIPPFVHQRGGAGGGHSGSYSQECCGACSSAFPRLLQPAFCCVEDLRVLETCHQSLDPQSLRGRVPFQDGDHPVCSPVCSSGRLDGLHRSQGSLPASPCPSGLSSLPSVCGTGQSVPVLCSLLWPLHGSAGLLTGHGSCFRHSPFLGYPHEAIPRRLACPVVLLRISPSRPSGSPRSLP